MVNRSLNPHPRTIQFIAFSGLGEFYVKKLEIGVVSHFFLYIVPDIHWRGGRVIFIFCPSLQRLNRRFNFNEREPMTFAIGSNRKGEKMFGFTGRVLGLSFLIASVAGNVFAAKVVLARKGKARCVVIVSKGTMAWKGDTSRLGGWKAAGRPKIIKEKGRRLLRDSVLDLALYLGKITGGKVEIIKALPANDKRVPIYVGAAAQSVFGPVGISMAGKFGFRVVADSKRGIGLYGESNVAASYAIYELLHRLGCRWYMPSSMGEVIPSSPDLAIKAMDLKLAPATENRSMWDRTGDPAFFRRNRLNSGTIVANGHALSLYLKYWDKAAAKSVADKIIAELDKDYVVSKSLSPQDGQMPTEDPEGRKFDPVPRVWEPAACRWSTTDRLVMLANRVAEQVGKKYPDVNFGMYAYCNYSMPPAREKVHPHVIPFIAPIDFNRHHPMNWPNHPNKFWLRDMVTGWAKKAPRWGYYAYGMNLAELTAPCPFITKWGTDLRILMENHMTIWQPETMGGWDSMLPGYYLAIRMTFYPEEKPEDILNEMWQKFYGPAAEPMGRYWNRIDRAWVDAKEYSGCLFGYLRIFTPKVMAGARADLNEALKKAGKPEGMVYKRVKLVEETFALFESFMKMREDWAAARLQNLGTNLNKWRKRFRELVAKYKDQKVLRGEPWSPSRKPGTSMAEYYVDCFVGHAYEDASKMESKYARVGKPMLNWKWKYNPGTEADSMPWTKPAYDDKDWATTQIVRDTWSTLGHHNTITDKASGRSGRMAYRTMQRLDALPKGKKLFLWIGSTDGSAKLFVNGKHIKYVVPEKTRRHKKGDVIDAFSGYCKPACFDVSSALVKGKNQITILCERTFLNELGTGGLMGPVVLYREK